MKKIIRLTESDLRQIVKESVNRVLKEGWTGRGYVPHDGNSMVGGYYGRSEINGEKDVMDDLLENVPISPEEWDGFCKYCEQNPNVFVIKGLISSEYDDSTGYGPTNILEDTTGEEEALQYVAKYPNQRIAQLAVQTLKGIFDKLTDEDFKLYDNDYELDWESDEH
jgi:hypothetical protein